MGLSLTIRLSRQMGLKQSRTVSQNPDPTSQVTIDEKNNSNQAQIDSKPPASSRATQQSFRDEAGLSGIALIEYKCRKKKRAWSTCVKDHYEHKFLPGQSLEPEEDCDDLFELYRQCYMRGLLKERQKKNTGPPKEGTMLHQFIEEEGLTVSDNRRGKEWWCMDLVKVEWIKKIRQNFAYGLLQLMFKRKASYGFVEKRMLSDFHLQVVCEIFSREKSQPVLLLMLVTDWPKD